MGWFVLDVLAARAGERFSASRRCRADVLETRIGGPGGPRVVLAKPRSYMNESGGPVAALRDFFKIAPDHTVAVHDELDLPFGSLRVKFGGGDNGHNGLKSMRRSLGTGDFFRARLGIGRPPGRQDPADYVLRPFASAERADVDVLAHRAADAIEALIRSGLQQAQQEFND